MLHWKKGFDGMGKFLENVLLHFLLDMISMIVEKMEPNVVEKNQFNFLQRLASGGWQTPLFYNLRCFLSPMQNVEKQKNIHRKWPTWKWPTLGSWISQWADFQPNPPCPSHSTWSGGSLTLLSSFYNVFMFIAHLFDVQNKTIFSGQNICSRKVR